MIRLYRWALRLLPKDFRTRFGEALLEEASASLAESSNRTARATTFAVLIADLLGSCAREWRDVLISGSGPGGEEGTVTEWLARGLQETRWTLRRLRKRPGFTVLVVSTYALGIGGMTAMFAVVHSVVIQPLPFEEPDELVAIEHVAPGLGIERAHLSAAMALTYAAENRVFDALGYWTESQVSVVGEGVPEQLPARMVSADLLPLLGVAPIVGRLFTAQDDTPEAAPTVLVSDQYWQTALGGDPGVIGRTLRVDGVQREIIGVVPLLDPIGGELYMPLGLDLADLPVGWAYRTVGRLASGASIEHAHADVERMIPLVSDAFPALTPAFVEQARLGPAVRPFKDQFVGDVGEVLWMLFGAVGIVFLVACGNVGNLFLVRTEARHRELAIRTALGSSRTGIVRQLIGESLALAMLSYGAGLALALTSLEGLRRMAPPGLPRLAEVSLTPTAMIFSLGMVITAGMLLGVVAALRSRGARMMEALKDGSRDGGEKLGRRVRDSLVVAQFALALVLLTGSALLVRSFRSLLDVTPGFERPEEVLTFRVGVPTTEVPNGAEVVPAYEEMWRALSAIPGVDAVGASTSVTLDGWGIATVVLVEDCPDQDRGEAVPPRITKHVTGNYFRTLESPVVAGRAIEWEDIRGASPIAMVTEDFAEEYWGRPEAALGRRVRVGEGEWREIVGVSGVVHDRGLHEPPTPVLYLPLDSTALVRRGLTFALRASHREANDLVPEARAAVAAVNPNLPVYAVRTLRDVRNDSMARTSFALTLMAIAAGFALVLGTVGIYGVVSYVVTRRGREIGLRMAVGADGWKVRAMVLREALRLAAMGVFIGLALSAACTRLLSSLLHGVSAMDPLSLGASAAVLTAVALMAAYMPARRASRIDPVEALRLD